jgi:hypothetical protein
MGGDLPTGEELDRLQWSTLLYDLHKTNPAVTFRIEQPRERLCCPQCGDSNVWAQGGEERTFRTIPIGAKPVQIQFKVPRVLCFTCGQVRQVKLGLPIPRNGTRVPSSVMPCSCHDT